MHYRPVSDKPECTIRQTDEDGQILLLCEADANPTDVTFMWKRVNESIPDSEVVSELVSAIRLDAVPESFGTYYCYVNNTLGRGSPCEIDVQGEKILRVGRKIRKVNNGWQPLTTMYASPWQTNPYIC